MLVKCVCSNCSHSYLADDGAGRLACPRCGVANEGTRNPSDIPDAPAGAEPGVYDPYSEEEFGFDTPRFDVTALPPMLLTRERMVRGIVFGGLATLLTGVVVGAALGAIKLILPGALAIVLALVAAPACRYGFGGRAARRSVGRGRITLLIVLAVGVAGYLGGSWAVGRITGTRAERARQDLDTGLKSLLAQAANAHDEGTRIVVEQRIAETRRLQSMSDAQLEDYLWVQQGGIKIPVAAYAEMRVLQGPVARLGADGDPIRLPSPAPAGILLAEIILGFFIGMRGIRAR